MTHPLRLKLACPWAALLVAVSAMMVGRSLLSPDGFFAAYGIQGDAAFQYSWSFRYMTILLTMCAALLLPQVIFLRLLLPKVWQQAQPN